MAKLKMEKLQANRMAKRALDLVSDLIDKHGPRLTGSEACLATAEELAAEMRPLCDRTEVESFFLHPSNFSGLDQVDGNSLPCGISCLLVLNYPLSPPPFVGSYSDYGVSVLPL